MSMKKKFLALALASAVAMPVVANATTANTQTQSAPDSQQIDADVTVEGTVLAEDGSAPEGRIQVELPSTMAFSVDKAGVFTTANNYKITNQSKTAGIDVAVTGFSETIKGGGITIDSYTNVSQNKTNTSRSTVGLKLNGNTGTAVDLSIGMGEEALFDNIAAGTSANMTLEGVAGTKRGSATQGVSENFTLNFKITKN